MNSKTAFIGMTNMGLSATAVWSTFSKHVIGLDENKKIIKSLQKGDQGYYEKGLDNLLKKGRTKIIFTNNFGLLKNVRLVYFAVDTKLTGNNRLKRLDQLIDLSIPNLSQNTTVVIMSQVPPGYCRNVKARISKARPGLKFRLYHWVDTIIMTQAIARLLNPEKIIIGQSEKDEKISTRLEETLKQFNCPVYYMSYESAEMTKAAINLYLATSVTYANTLSDYCEAVGANINDIIPALRADKRIGQYAYLRPTLRIAGGHIERDITMLNLIGKSKDLLPNVTSTILNLNKSRYEWALKKIKVRATVCFWGLAYKKDSASTHNAASLLLIKKLSKSTKINAYDPIADMPKSTKGYQRFEDKYEALKNAECLVILTEWDEFRDLDIKRLKKLMKSKIIIDCVGILHDKEKELNDFTYISMGHG